MKVKLTTDGTSQVTIINCHPALVPKGLNEAHINFIVELINLSSGPIIIMGDFNSPPTDSQFLGFKALGFKHVMNPNDDPNFVYPVTRQASINSIDAIYYRGLTLVSSSG
jgi:endonuclease/exonuclease/phosphatase (EEP) superfamily protein YafD